MVGIVASKAVRQQQATSPGAGQGGHDVRGGDVGIDTQPHGIPQSDAGRALLRSDAVEQHPLALRAEGLNSGGRLVEDEGEVRVVVGQLAVDQPHLDMILWRTRPPP